MPSTLFLALQCIQCSTMQVKQQKKSSNKWVCVICNQKQSVRKVFARGYKAKELRFFVQSFNMSRKTLEEEDHTAADTVSQVDVDGDADEETPADCRKRHTDWSEYLDLDPRNHCRRSPSPEGIDAKIVTEMPKNMFKRPKLNHNSNARGSPPNTGGREDGNELYKPIFSRRSINKQELRSEKESKRQNVMEQRNLIPGGVSKSASKWKAYLTQEEEEEEKEEDRTLPRLGQREALEDGGDAREWSRAVLDISMADQTVDDEVHPDFM